MEKVELFNGDFIESVNVTEGRSVSRLVYKKEINFIFYKRKTGFYDDYPGNYYGSSEDLLNGSYDNCRILVKDNKAYWRPFVEIRMVSGYKTGKHFDTIEECNKYAKDIMDRFVPRQFKINKV